MQDIMYKKILIANRGAIATRIIRTLKRMGIQSVAVYNKVDRDSLHVQHADEAYSLGEGRAADTYLDQDKIFEIVKQSGAQAIHPGYGFLSENSEFVKRCESEGIDFIGPTAEQMLSFGLKHSARELAKSNGAPLLPGSDLLDSVEEALVEADKIGYPVMLKSTAGGGGIGMQLCWNAEQLKETFNSVRRLSENNFSNGGVFLEKFIEYARHIEVQVFGDGKGGAIALGERDCSTQRRNQKVIEETPAPNISDLVRKELQQTALQLVKAVNYRSAGTVEYVYDQKTEQFYFLEVNTRLQVEHGVTEEIFNIDLVEWMVRLAANEFLDFPIVRQSNKHSIQARIYAEDPNKNFQPSAGLLSQVEFPNNEGLRIDHWLETGIEVSALFDPLLAKVIVTANDRQTAITQLNITLENTHLYGLECNIKYLREILQSDIFRDGNIYTRYLNTFKTHPNTIDVLSGGTLTSIQDFPGRTGYWDVGVPPSGPFDNYSFRLANQLLDNHSPAAGLEITLNGPTLRFNQASQIVLAGAEMQANLDDVPVPFWQVINVAAGQTLTLGKVKSAGARAYLCIKDGLQCPSYLGSKSTFTLGQIGGHAGRALLAGDVLQFSKAANQIKNRSLPVVLIPEISHNWELHVIYGPHGAPVYFTDKDIDMFFKSEWEVHYNSSRTGIRLVGPKPEWARSDGGEAGMHPSNIHDNAYAIGTVDFTGDMPVILGPDGPSLGGFVCPATVVSADLWKLGQLKAGDKVTFISISINDAVAMDKAQWQSISKLHKQTIIVQTSKPKNPIIHSISQQDNGVKVIYRPSGDAYLLVEYGDSVLDIELRFRVHALMLWLKQNNCTGILELTPGIRSLQVHYDYRTLSLNKLLDTLIHAESELKNNLMAEVPARIVHLPLSWNDEACQLAINKYMQSVRKDAPWCPNNIEFIRRINGLDNIDQVKQTVFDASYLVMGLGDVYLGAPVATPIDPRHRLVTTKYNPARTWTAENSVGIGGSYLCVYGMEGPGGYQFIGRTLQMWNRYHKTKEFEQPWLLRFFDQIRFYEVTTEELTKIREDFPKGRYPVKIENTTFNLKKYQRFLTENASSIAEFTKTREIAFDQELQRWIKSGQINFESESELIAEMGVEDSLPDSCVAIESVISGNIWQVLVKEGDVIKKNQPLIIIESMKMEIEITAPHEGIVYAIKKSEGSQVNSGQTLLILQTTVLQNTISQEGNS